MSAAHIRPRQLLQVPREGCCASYQPSSKLGGSIRPPFSVSVHREMHRWGTFRIELASVSSSYDAVREPALVPLLAMPNEWRHFEPDRPISHAFPDSFSPAREQINFRAAICRRIGTSDDGIHDRPAHLHRSSRAQLSLRAAGHTRRARSPDRGTDAATCAIRCDRRLEMGGWVSST